MNIFCEVLNCSPDFYYHINGQDKYINSLMSQCETMYKSFLEIERIKKENMLALSELEKNMTKFSFFLNDNIQNPNFIDTQDPFELNLIEMVKNSVDNFKSTISKSIIYEQMCMEQTFAICKNFEKTLYPKMETFNSARSSVKAQHQSFKEGWKKFSDLQHVSNLKDKSHFEKAAIKCIIGKKNFQEQALNYMSVIKKSRNLVFKNFFQFLNDFALCNLSLSHNLDQIYKNYTQNEDLDNMNQLNANFKEKFKLEDQNVDRIRSKVIGQTSQALLQFNLSYFEQVEQESGIKNAFAVNESSSDAVLNKSGILDKFTKFIAGNTHKLNALKKTTNISESFNATNYSTITNNNNNNKQQIYGDNQTEANDVFRCEYENKNLKEHFYQSYQIYDDVHNPMGLLLVPFQLKNSIDPEFRFDFKYSETEKSSQTHTNTNIINNYSRDVVQRHSEKQGYLRVLVKKNYHKYTLKPLYFYLSVKKGKLFSQGFNERRPRLFVSFNLVSVQLCRPSEFDRNYCIKLTTPNNEFILQAMNQSEMECWFESFKKAISSSLSIKKQSFSVDSVSNTNDTAEKRALSTLKKKDDSALEVEDLRMLPGNDKCADCFRLEPEWASTTFGVLLCITCSGIHRSLGVHVSKVKSLNLDNWTKESLARMMEQGGNDAVNGVYEAELDRGALEENALNHYNFLNEFIIMKYQLKKYMKK